jgi:hypothetical protein
VAGLVSLTVADRAELWVDLGFAVADGRCVVDGVVHVLTGADTGRGIREWALDGVGIPADGCIDGLVTHGAVRDGLAGGSAHPNGVTTIDHVVVATPDIERTVGALGAAGLTVRRWRDSETYGTGMRQAFFKLGTVILEVVGPPSAMGGGPAGFFGLAFTVADLDATAAFFGARLNPAKAAVQPGRRIATLGKAAGSGVAMAFMSPGPVEYA